MNKGWKTTKLEAVCEMYQPKTISQEEMISEGEYPVFGANGIIGRYDKYNHEEPQLLVTCRGATCGTINISEPYSWITGNSMVVLPKNKNEICFEYLSLYLQQKNIMLTVITGAAQPQITRSNLKELKISYPENIAQQHQIAATLDKASELIALRKKQLAELDALAESVFYDMFGDPVKNEKGWEKKSLNDICTKITDGKHGDCIDMEDSGFYFVSAKDIMNRKIVLDKARQITKNDFEETNKRTLLSTGDVIVVNTGATIGKTTIATNDDVEKNITFQKSVALITVDETYLLNYYLESYIIICREKIYEEASGSAQKNWLLSQMRNYKILLPPISLQTHFATIIEKIEQQKVLVKKALQESEDLFQRLMQDLFNPD